MSVIKETGFATKATDCTPTILKSFILSSRKKPTQGWSSMILKSKINKGAGVKENPVAVTQKVMRFLFSMIPGITIMY